MHLDLVRGARENGRAAAGAKESTGIALRFATDHYRILRKYGGGIEEGAVMLATVETMTNANTAREPRSHKPQVAAKATTNESLHLCFLGWAVRLDLYQQ